VARDLKAFGELFGAACQRAGIRTRRDGSADIEPCTETRFGRDFSARIVETRRNKGEA